MNIIKIDDVKNKIYTIRGKQVMLDSDLAKMYQVETKQLNKAVNRNLQRFPEHFRFQLTQEEYDYLLRFQIGTSSSTHGGRRYLPYVFTEQGVAMLSAVLRSDIAVKVSIAIIDAFVEMRQIINNNSLIFERFERIESRLSIHDKQINQLFDTFQIKQPQIQGIFHNGQIYDAYAFINDLLKSAKDKVILIDNYIDDSVLTLFSKYDLKYTIITKNISKQLKLDIEKYNSQYNNLEIKTSNRFHDRFLIIDTKCYHIGASLKDLGKKVFGFNKIDINLLKGLL